MRHIVIDTNVFVSALLSQRGAAFRLMMLLDKELFRFSLSVPLVVEYEDAATRVLSQTRLTHGDLNDVLDYVCRVGERQSIYYLWRPFLSDPRDDMVLEVAVAAACDTIITYNEKDFAGTEMFGLQAMEPRTFLRQIGVLP